jgi:hypothetical protein
MRSARGKKGRGAGAGVGEVRRAPYFEGVEAVAAPDFAAGAAAFVFGACPPWAGAEAPAGAFTSWTRRSMI